MNATISACRRYRYWLEREVPASLLTDDGYTAARTLGVVMVNPSTADATQDDATIRKVMGFAARLGYGRVIVGNKFAFRSTDIRGLRDPADPIGPENDDHLLALFHAADTVVAAWGPLTKLPPRLRTRWKSVVAMARRAETQLHALAVAQDGQPCHPLMLGYDRPLVAWPSPTPSSGIGGVDG